MVNKSKVKGTAAETRVVNFLLAAGLDARRVVQKGSHDEGDIHIIGMPAPPGCTWAILEVKGGKQTQNVNRKLKEDWLKETIAEGENAGVPRAFLVIAKHGSSVRDYHVWSTDGHEFWYLDEFTDYVKGGF